MNFTTTNASEMNNCNTIGSNTTIGNTTGGNVSSGSIHNHGGR